MKKNIAKASLAVVAGAALFFVAVTPNYDRQKHFGGWIDIDKDCQNTRHEVLIAESQVPVTLTEDGCQVDSGYWVCPYTGKVFTDPRKMDIDHMVPLKEAWVSGASEWSKEQRVAFANDLDYPDHLVATEASANRKKSAKDPGLWLPEQNKSWYVEEWLRVKENYNLNLDPREVRAILDNK